MTTPDTAPSKEDFDRSGWEELVVESDRKMCYLYSRLFAEKAREAEASGDNRAQEVFALLSAITSLHMQLESPDEPFGPMFVLTNSRSAIPDDFTDAQLGVLKEVASEASDPEIRARITDVLWVRKRDFRMAELAVSSYMESADALGDLNHWVPYTDRVERAVQLAASLGRSAERFQNLMTRVEDAIDEHEGEEDSSFPIMRSMRLLQDYGRGDAPKYTDISERRAEQAEIASEWARARAYWEIKARWSQMQHDDEGKRDALIKGAETHVQEAEQALNQSPPSYITASSHLSRAIEGLRRVGGMQERVEALHRTLLEYQHQTREELGLISSSADFTEFAERAREEVRGKSLLDALVALARMLIPPNKAELRRNVEESARDSISALVSMDVVNDAGRVVARRPSRFSSNPEEVETAIRADMYSQATFHQQGFAAAKVEPARQQINLEHNARVQDVLPFVSNNPFVPAGREIIFAQGLYHGLNGNFLVATHLLIPQIEHSVRHILTEQGVIVSTLSSSAIQAERNLNQTLYQPKLEELWGEDLTFDLQGLLVEKFGSNLRNKMAHGLMGPEEFSSYSVAYLWWITLFLCYVHLAINNQARTSETSEPEEEN